MKKTCIKYVGLQFIFYLLVQAVLRTVFFLTAWKSASFHILDLFRTYGIGFIYDSMTGFYYCLPLALLLFSLPTGWFGKKKSKIPIVITTFFMNLFLFFVAVSQFFFWQEFYTNFNFIAVDYLIYTTEVVGMIVESRAMFIMVPVIVIVALLTTYLETKLIPLTKKPVSWKKFGCSFAAALVLAFLLPNVVQEKWRHEASANIYDQEIAGNGPYCFVYAFFNNELNYNQFYVTENDAKVVASLRNLLQTSNSTYVNKDDVTRKIVNQNNLSDKKPNIVVITVESLSSDYVGAFGAKESYTPYLDKLAKESYIFTKMLATGTRTVRGLEAISLSLPPTPGQSIVRRLDCENQQTLGYVLDGFNYKSDFIYGGYGYFDNMNYFFENNGYTVKDHVSIPKEEIFNETIWGVADEILFSQVLKSLDQHFANQEPAFEMVMTTTNHRPWKFPEGRVNQPQGYRKGGVAYTDWAIHDFLERASQKPWFANTVFVVIADHQAGVAGKTELPVHRYRIPCLVYAPQLISPGVNNRLISQMDLAPTLLGMLGRSYQTSFLGLDINQVPEGKERAFISTYQLLGYVKGDELLILGPNKTVTQYHIDNWLTSDYTPKKADPTLKDEAVTWYQGAYYLYKQNKFKQQ